MCWNKLKPMSEIKVGDQFKNKSVSFWKCLTVLKKPPFVTSLTDFYWNRRADSLSVFWPKNSVSVVLNTTSWDSSLCCLCETFISLWRPLVSRISYLEHSSLHLGLWCYWCTVWWLHNRHFKSGAFFFLCFPLGNLPFECLSWYYLLPSASLEWSLYSLCHHHTLKSRS